MIRVLVVDDSPLFRRVLSDLLSGDPEIGEVITAGNGEIALKKLRQSQPDVITMDLEMPGIGGIEVIERIMSSHPIPIVVVSALDGAKQNLSLRAMELGIVDIIEKPGGDQSGLIDQITEQLLETVKSAAKVRLGRRDKEQSIVEAKSRIETRPVPIVSQRFGVVAIGASTGGPIALREVLTGLPKHFSVGIIAALHMPASFTSAYAERLDTLCKVHVREAKNGDKVRPANVLIAPGDVHLKVVNSEGVATASLESTAKVNNHRPSLDVLMESVSETYGGRALAVIMTGMGRDGAGGISQLKKKGGYVIAQDEASSVIFGMNRAVIENGDADEVHALGIIAERLIQLTDKTTQ